MCAALFCGCPENAFYVEAVNSPKCGRENVPLNSPVILSLISEDDVDESYLDDGYFILEDVGPAGAIRESQKKESDQEEASGGGDGKKVEVEETDKSSLPSTDSGTSASIGPSVPLAVYINKIQSDAGLEVKKIRSEVVMAPVGFLKPKRDYRLRLSKEIEDRGGHVLVSLPCTFTTGNDKFMKNARIVSITPETLFVEEGRRSCSETTSAQRASEGELKGRIPIQRSQRFRVKTDVPVTQERFVRLLSASRDGLDSTRTSSLSFLSMLVDRPYDIAARGTEYIIEFEGVTNNDQRINLSVDRGAGVSGKFVTNVNAKECPVEPEDGEYFIDTEEREVVERGTPLDSLDEQDAEGEKEKADDKVDESEDDES